MDSGDGGTHCVPFYEGYELPHGVTTLASYLVYELLVGPASATAHAEFDSRSIPALRRAAPTEALVVPLAVTEAWLQAVAQHRAVAAVQEKANSEAQGQRLR